MSDRGRIINEKDIKFEKYPWGKVKTLHHSANLSVFLLNMDDKMLKHKHEKHEEIYIVEKGIGEIVVDEISEIVEIGDTITVPKGKWHYLKPHVQGVEFEVLSIITPGYEPDDSIVKEKEKL